MSSTQEPRMLQNWGHRLFSFAHCIASKLVQIPKPVLGSAIDKAEDAIAPRVQPLVEEAENRSINLLSFLDEQLYFVGGLIETCLHSALTVATCPLSSFQAAVTKVRRRGVVGCAADLCVAYEDPVRSYSESLFKLLHRAPGFGFVSPLICGVGDAVSNWLAEHSEIKEKHLLAEEKPLESKQDLKDEGSEDEEEELPYVEAKLSAEQDPAIVESPREHNLVKEKEQHKQQQKSEEEDEQDELTKLIDAGWGLGTL